MLTHSRRGLRPAGLLLLVLLCGCGGNPPSGGDEGGGDNGNGGGGTPPPPPQSGGAVITLSPETRFQTIAGWKTGDYIGGAPDNHALRLPVARYRDALMDQAFGDLGLTHIDVGVKSGAENSVDNYRMYLDGTITPDRWRCVRYSTTNDNGNAGSLNPAGFHWTELDERMTESILPAREAARRHGIDLQLTLTYVAFTGQMTAAGCPGGLDYHHGNAAEYAEFVVAAFDHLRSRFGVVPNSLDVILEPDNSRFWNNGRTIGEALRAVHERLENSGFRGVKLIAPSTTNTANASVYFDAMRNVSGVLGALTELSYHRYSADSLPNVRAIAERAAANNLQSTMNERIGASYVTLHEDLKEGRNSSWKQNVLAGTLVPDDGGKYYLVNLDDPSNPRVVIAGRTRFLRQYMRFIRPGAVRIGASTTNNAFDPLAFINSDGNYVVVVKATSAGSFTVRGLPAGTYNLTHTAGTEYNVTRTGSVSRGADLTASVPGAGAITIYIRTSNLTGDNVIGVPTVTDAASPLYETHEDSSNGADAHFRLALAPEGPGSGWIEAKPLAPRCRSACERWIQSGIVLTLFAHAEPGASFAGWSGDPDCADGVVTMSGARSCVARFVQEPTTGKLDLSGDGVGDVFLYDVSTGEWSMAAGSLAGGYRVTRAGSGAADLNIRAARVERGTVGLVVEEAVKADRPAVSHIEDLRGLKSVESRPNSASFAVDLEGQGESGIFRYSPLDGSWSRCARVTHGSACESGVWEAAREIYPVEASGDRAADFLLYDRRTGEWRIAISNGRGGFASASGVMPAGAEVYPADFDADGRSDLLLSDADTGEWSLLLWNGRSFVSHSTGRWPAGWTIRTGELNGLNGADLLLYDRASGEWLMFLNVPREGFQREGGGWPAGREVLLTDHDGDGVDEILLYSRTTGEWSQAARRSHTFTLTEGVWPAGALVVAGLTRLP